MFMLLLLSLISGCFHHPIAPTPTFNSVPNDSANIATVYIVAWCAGQAFDVRVTARDFTANITGLCQSQHDQYYRCRIPIGLGGDIITRASIPIPDREATVSYWTAEPGAEVASTFSVSRNGYFLVPLGLSWFTRDSWPPDTAGPWPGDTSFGTPDTHGSQSDNPACEY